MSVAVNFGKLCYILKDCSLSQLEVGKLLLTFQLNVSIIIRAKVK